MLAESASASGGAYGAYLFSSCFKGYGLFLGVGTINQFQTRQNRLICEQNLFLTLFSGRPTSLCEISFHRLPSLLQYSMIAWSSSMVQSQVFIEGSNLFIQRQRICFPDLLATYLAITPQFLPISSTSLSTSQSQVLVQISFLCRRLHNLRQRWRHWLVFLVGKKLEMIFQSKKCLWARLSSSSSYSLVHNFILRLRYSFLVNVILPCSEFSIQNISMQAQDYIRFAPTPGYEAIRPASAIPVPLSRHLLLSPDSARIFCQRKWFQPLCAEVLQTPTVQSSQLLFSCEEHVIDPWKSTEKMTLHVGRGDLPLESLPREGLLKVLREKEEQGTCISSQLGMFGLGLQLAKFISD